MSTEAAYSIADLARLTGVSVRTIRYYLAQGLLPTSGESGPGAHYGDGHLHRLQLTRRLQEQHLPLAEIRRRLAELTDVEIANLIQAPSEPTRASTSSALDYVRTVLGTDAADRAMPPSLAMATSPVPAGAGTRSAALMRRALHGPMSVVSEPAQASSPAPPTATEPAAPERSQWERLSLGPNVEIHVRRPLSRLEQRRVERLITIARQVLKEEMK